MEKYLGIFWLYGRPNEDAQKYEHAAIDAALHVLRVVGVPAETAKEEYCKQLHNDIIDSDMSGAALAWVAAERAANRALTLDWPDPNAAKCFLVIIKRGASC